MNPYISLFQYKISIYGLLIIIGLFLGIMISIYLGKRRGQKSEDILYASIYASIGLIIGAKILYILVNLSTLIEYADYFIKSPRNMIIILSGGFVFYGGLIGAIIGIYIYCKQYKLSFIELLETIVPTIPLIHAFGRIGCFFAGCCYGKPYEGLFHIIYHNSESAPNNIALFPVQIVESGLNFLSFIIILIFTWKIREKYAAIGLYLVTYSIIRFILEYYRGDIERGFLLFFSTSQWISIFCLPIGLILMYKSLSKDKLLKQKTL